VGNVSEETEAGGEMTNTQYPHENLKLVSLVVAIVGICIVFIGIALPIYYPEPLDSNNNWCATETHWVPTPINWIPAIGLGLFCAGLGGYCYNSLIKTETLNSKKTCPCCGRILE
jgi:hypothetical protein